MKKSLYINSDLDRQATDTNSKWTTYLAQPFDFTQFKRISVGLKNIQVPNTAYNFSEYNSSIWYELDNGGTPQLYSVNVRTDKHYENVPDWIADLNTDCIHNLVFSFNNSNKKISVKNNQGTNLRMLSSYIYENQPNNGNGRLGITKNISNWILPGQTQTFENVPKLIRTNCYFLCCDIIDKTGEIPYPYFNPLILNKFTTRNFGELVDSVYDTVKYIGVADRTIDKIGFFIIDDELQTVDFNGSHITLELEFIVE